MVRQSKINKRAKARRTLPEVKRSEKADKHWRQKEEEKKKK